MVEVLLSRNIRAQQIAAAAIADICVAAPRLQDAFLRVRCPPPPCHPARSPTALQHASSRCLRAGACLYLRRNMLPPGALLLW